MGNRIDRAIEGAKLRLADARKMIEYEEAEIDKLSTAKQLRSEYGWNRICQRAYYRGEEQACLSLIQFMENLA